jgi:biopolymer transport protein ExbD
MAMTLSSGADGDPMVDMNTTPLIDVMLVLLIMFIITLPVMTNNTRIDLPQVPSGKTTPSEAISLSIDYDGTMVWNGNVVSGLEQLEQYLRSAAAQPVQPELHVRPDKRAKYDHVAQVLAMAQRNGIQRIGFAGQEQFSD